MRYVLKYIDGVWQRHENDPINFCMDVMQQLGLIRDSVYRMSVRTTPKKTHIKVRLTPGVTREDGSHLWKWHIDNINSELPHYFGTYDQDRLLDKLFPGTKKNEFRYLWVRFVKIA